VAADCALCGECRARRVAAQDDDQDSLNGVGKRRNDGAHFDAHPTTVFNFKVADAAAHVPDDVAFLPVFKRTGCARGRGRARSAGRERGHSRVTSRRSRRAHPQKVPKADDLRRRRLDFQRRKDARGVLQDANYLAREFGIARNHVYPVAKRFNDADKARRQGKLLLE